MRHAALLKNMIRNYPWGSTTAIPEILGQKPDGAPQAELWMGAHPDAPSEALVDGRWVPLSDLIDASPETVLGSSAGAFRNRLPYLFKILAAENPLSIQAHPDAFRAREGFLRETAAGIPRGAFNRSYKDDSHKPECLCAITPFWALNGFRKIEDILSNLRSLCPEGLSEEVAALEKHPSEEGLRRFFHSLMTLPDHQVEAVLLEAVTRAGTSARDPVCVWIGKLFEAYPRDRGVLFPAILNLIHLEPGQALYLSSGRLHAYLHGVGMELMANSDNVLRGGLTSKYRDVSGLLEVLSFEETLPDVLSPIQESPGVKVYPIPAKEFLLSEISVQESLSYTSPEEHGVEILFCFCGLAHILEICSGRRIDVQKGTSVLIPASLAGYRIEGEAVFYRASVGRAF